MNGTKKEAMVSRSFSKDTIVFKTFEGKEPLWSKPVNGSATDKEIVKSINEFTDKHWDKKTPWYHAVEQEFEVYGMSQSEFKKVATKLEGEAKAERVKQIKDNRSKRK